MKTEKTIKICGKQVRIRYCTATETGYETITGKSSSIFLPGEENGKKVPSKAGLEDYISLALAGIIAAYAAKDEDPPVESKDIMYEASSAEINELVKTIVTLRREWYTPPVTSEEEKDNEEKEDSEKNS